MPTRSDRRILPWRWARYLIAFIGPLLAVTAMTGTGLTCWSLPIYGFVLIPLTELFLSPRHNNLSEAEEHALLSDGRFDRMLYLFVPIQYGILLLFLVQVGRTEVPLLDRIGMTASMGMMCGVYGINIAHELGHRRHRWERDLGRALLVTSMYVHFIIEHNRGHHRQVGTSQDPASARAGEWLWTFWVRAIAGSFRGAWRLEAQSLANGGVPVLSWRNEMLRGLAVELSLVLAIGFLFGPQVLGFFLVAALIGVLLLETVNYVEHYGLHRARRDDGRYVKVEHIHSWNSDHLLGRLTLFELSRHSDHHAKASTKYQVLRSPEDAPQLPTGYPGMMLLALLPPLWQRVMHPRIERLLGSPSAAGRLEALAVAS
ncbi:MAG: alkane 1-monooxygenase [Flavobacteriales bacterium]|nr:alkane 1-monooxygenase [Flavobacteriales bacterium]